MHNWNQFRIATESVVRSRIILFVIVVLALLVPVFGPGQLVKAKSAAETPVSREQPKVSRIGSSNPIPSRLTMPMVPSGRSDSSRLDLGRITSPKRFAIGAPVPTRFAAPQGGGYNWVDCQSRGRSCGYEQLGCPSPWIPTWCGAITYCCAQCCYQGVCGPTTPCGGGECTC